MSESTVLGKHSRDEAAAFDDAVLPMSEEEILEAKRMAEIAERAERRALEKLQERNIVETNSNASVSNNSNSNNNVAKEKELVFLTKKQREQLALENLEKRRLEQENKMKEAKLAHDRFITGKTLEEKRKKELIEREREEQERIQRQKDEKKESKEFDHEVKAIRNHYLGIKEQKRKIAKPSEKFARIFQFEWEEADDTMRDNMNPLYSEKIKINPLFGRGYMAGIDLREQRKNSNYLLALSDKRIAELKQQESQDDTLTAAEKKQREIARIRAADMLKRRHEEEVIGAEGLAGAKLGLHWSEKQLEDMTERDWRIFREDFDIRVQGGRASLPLRNWAEANLPPPLLRAINTMGYEKPSPIQRQAIPIGQDFRDIIGIAETGNNTTLRFICV
jgi:ATP-dependent RNA helicase DDX23/PRP28